MLFGLIGCNGLAKARLGCSPEAKQLKKQTETQLGSCKECDKPCKQYLRKKIEKVFSKQSKQIEWLMDLIYSLIEYLSKIEFVNKYYTKKIEKLVIKLIELLATTAMGGSYDNSYPCNHHNSCVGGRDKPICLEVLVLNWITYCGSPVFNSFIVQVAGVIKNVVPCLYEPRKNSKTSSNGDASGVVSSLSADKIFIDDQFERRFINVILKAYPIAFDKCAVDSVLWLICFAYKYCIGECEYEDCILLTVIVDIICFLVKEHLKPSVTNYRKLLMGYLPKSGDDLIKQHKAICNAFYSGVAIGKSVFTRAISGVNYGASCINHLRKSAVDTINQNNGMRYGTFVYNVHFIH
ncbi:MAG: hypothetical protein NMK33_00240 [Candidatus Cardinium sp.]|nr:hypothetical protein FPG78_02920 [Cardinium endosymbiont of Dermatophagoides farinae]UWW96992.1 MAG: hypothetical protein NMK33_00240 [Candidatus Cardinium sp.]